MEGVHGDTCIPADTCVPGDTCIPRDTCIPMDTRIPWDTCIPGDTCLARDRCIPIHFPSPTIPLHHTPSPSITLHHTPSPSITLHQTLIYLQKMKIDGKHSKSIFGGIGGSSGEVSARRSRIFGSRPQINLVSKNWGVQNRPGSNFRWSK